MSTDELLKHARNAREQAYSPYSEFSVGAALQCSDGTIYKGANIENVNLTNTVHAEQVALHKAVFDGKRDFEAIAISLSGDPVPPCGLCRQSLSEFAEADLDVIVEDLGTYTLSELLPGSMESIE